VKWKAASQNCGPQLTKLKNSRRLYDNSVKPLPLRTLPPLRGAGAQRVLAVATKFCATFDVILAREHPKSRARST
jgi:hypothetical protein